MKNKWILFLCPFAAVAGLLAFAVTRQALNVSARTPIDRLHDVSFLTRELNLSAVQAAQIKTLHDELGGKLDDSCGRHCAARMRLGPALANEVDGGAQAEDIVAEMCRAYEESELATLNHLRRVHEVLDAEQRKQFYKMLTECVCRACPACHASGGHRGH